MNTSKLCLARWSVVLTICLGVLAGEARGQFVAFNEHAGGANTSPNATFWTVPLGTNKNAGLLKNITNGVLTKVRLTVQTNSAPRIFVSGFPTNASPASNVFGKYVTFGNQMYFLTNDQQATYTFSGLDPDKSYSIKGTTISGRDVNHNADRWTLFELTGADNFANAHTTGCLTGDSNTFGLASNQVVLCTGDNRVGDIFDWERIAPALDGIVVINVRKFYGPTNSIPSLFYNNDWSSPAAVFGLEALRIEEFFVARPPRIVVPPTNLWVSLGGSNGLNALVMGPPPLSCQWYKGNAENTASNAIRYATNSILAIPTASLDDAGFYTLVVTNSSGQTVCPPVQVTVWATAPFFQVQPTNTTALEDTTATFTAQALGVWPISYQWYQGGHAAADVAIPGATSNGLTILAAETNTGPFYLVASNTLGVSTSLVASLSVAYDPVVITSQPADQTVSVGTDASFSVSVTGRKTHYQWFLRNVALLDATNATLALTHVTPGQSGDYQALIWNPSSTNWSRTALLTVTRPPHPLVGTNQLWWFNDTGPDLGTAWKEPSYPPADQWSNGPGLLGFRIDAIGNYMPANPNVVPGWGTFQTRLSRVGSASGTINLTYYLRSTFTQDGSFAAPGMGLTFSNLVDDGAIFYLNGAEISRYNMPAGVVNYQTLATVATNPSVWYYFTVPGTLLLPGTNVVAVELHQANPMGGDIDWLSLITATYASPGPLTITNQPADLVVPEGRSALFEIGLSNTASIWAEYQWYRVAHNQTQAVAGATASTLQITNTRSGWDDGAYFVTVSNPVFWTYSRLASLALIPAPPLVTTAMSNSTVCIGQPVQLQVTAYGTPPLSYQWTFNDVPIPDATNASFQLTSSANAEVAGLYAVAVGNLLGTAESLPALLRVVPNEPAFSLQPVEAVTAAGQTVVFGAEATGCPTPVLQWQYMSTNLPGATNALLLLTNVQFSQGGVYRVVASNEAGVTFSQEARLFLPTLGETLNCPGLLWTNLTTAPWQAQNLATHDGFAALQTTATKSNEQSTLATMVTGPTRISFWWKLQASDAAPRLEFLVDGVVRLSATVARAWQPAGLFIPSGSHALSWRFSVNNSTNAPTAWLDEVEDNPAALSPSILAPPSSLRLPVGLGGNLEVVAVGLTPLRFTWQADGVTVPGASQATYAVPPAPAAGSVIYTAIVSDDSNSVSATAEVTVTNSAPGFGSTPSFVRAPEGVQTVLSARAYGSLPLTYQWWFNGSALPGETNALLCLRPVRTNQIGSYWVVVSNSLGTATGPAMPLLVSRVLHVIHLSVDGLGASYLAAALSNSPASYPNFMRLVTEGAFTLNARCDCTDSITVPNHLCMLTGRPVRQPAGQPNTVPHGYTLDGTWSATATVHKDGNTNVPYKASVLDVVHDRGLQTALMVGKTSLAICSQSYNGLNGAPDLLPPDNGRSKMDHLLVVDELSSVIVDAFLPILTNVTPCDYAFLHFCDPDRAGHNYGWGSTNYYAALQDVDSQLGRILQAIDQNPALAAPGQTALIVTSDHGGQGRWHDDPGIFNNFAIPILARGAGFLPGAELYSLFTNRADPGAAWLDYNAVPQPLRNGDLGNLALSLLGLPSIPGSSLIPVFATLRPVLSVSQSGAGVRVEWSTSTVGFTLETSGHLGSGATWLPVTRGIVTNHNQFIYDLAPDSGARFFRLTR